MLKLTLRNSIFICALLFLVFSCTDLKNKENLESDYAIIPKPQKVMPLKGRFCVNSKVVIVAEEILREEASYLKGLIGAGIEEKSDASKGLIRLVLDSIISNDEGYKLSVKHDGITISGKSKKGVFYGIQTLRQLMPDEIENPENNIKTFTIPAVEIEDSPRFVYRGMHLDVGRHFFSVAFIKKYIDLIAMHKMNTFHWHLTEDQGWRIEIKKYPKLTEIGAYRAETIIGHGSKWQDKDVKYDGKRYGGFYTQEEIKEIVNYANKRHVTIIPEIELPGHSLAAISSYPELGNFGDQYEVGIRWGVFSEIYAPTEKTFAFLEDVLSEVITLFPSKYIHIGGDEAPKKQWKESKFAQQLIKEKKLKDEHGLQSYFIQRIENFLNSKGRTIIGWDEILEGGLAPNATVMSWRGTKGGIAAAKEHHNVIMTPGHSCYFDHYQVKSKEAKEKEPLAIGGNTTVADVYAYEPIPQELNKEEQKYILGAQGNVWTEYIKTSDHVEYMILPRMSALSEVVWSDKKGKNYGEFLKRLKILKNRFEALKLNYAKHAFTEVK